MKKSLLLWLLPVVDVFAIHRILREYSSLGVDVPWGHAKAGLVEKWAGYMLVGFIASWFVGFKLAVAFILLAAAIALPPEFYLMSRGVKPWKFFKGKPTKIVAKIFLLECYNVFCYYLLGVALAALVSHF